MAGISKHECPSAVLQPLDPMILSLCSMYENKINTHTDQKLERTQRSKYIPTAPELKGTKTKTTPECFRNLLGFASPQLKPSVAELLFSSDLLHPATGKPRVFTTQEFTRGRLVLCHMTPGNPHSKGGADATRKCAVYKYYSLLKPGCLF